jgi:hypothetical protein
MLNLGEESHSSEMRVMSGRFLSLKTTRWLKAKKWYLS